MPKKIIFTAAFLLLAAGCNTSQLMPQTKSFIPASPKSTATSAPLEAPSLHTVGQVTRHAAGFIKQRVRVQGYMLKKENGYIIFSDEAVGAINQYDMPVKGLGIETVEPKHKYALKGLFLNTGLSASNHNPNHLELEIVPKLIQ